jgi:toxin FitB
LSELRKRRLANANVQAWYRTVDNSDLFTSVLVIGEIRREIELKRPTNPAFAAKLERWLKWIQEDFQNKILPVTLEIAEVWGTLSPTRLMTESDGLIAATAMYHNLTK